MWPPLIWAAVAALLGCCALLLSPELPPRGDWWLALGMVALGTAGAVLVYLRTGRGALGVRSLILLLTAVGFSAQLALRSEVLLSDRLTLPEQGQDWVVELVLQGLPNQSAGPHPVWMTEASLLSGPRPGARLSLAWSAPPVPLEPGQVWRLPVRLKNLSGTLNPHGFDPETWAFGKGLMLQGSVRSGRQASAPVRLADDMGLFSRIDRLRYETRKVLASALEGRAHWGVISGLVVGDQAVIPAEHWALFSQTGISHLVSISGMHVTLFAVAARAAAAGLWRLLSLAPLRLALWVPFPPVGALVAAGAALGYALLAGFNLPAQRTAFMVITASLATLAGRQLGTWGILGITLLVTLAVEPTAPLSAGFWLSYFAVWLLFAQPETSGALRSAVRAQWVMTIGLAPLTVAFFHQISLVGPLANAVAIPVVTYVVTPLALVGAPLAALGLVEPVVWAEAVFGGLMSVMQEMAGWGWSLARWHAPPLWACVLACLGVAWALQPPHPGVSARVRRLGWLAPLLLALGGQAAPSLGEVEVTALDIGQGTAVLIRTHTHTLLYDTGPTMGGSTAARKIILLQLQAAGVGPLDLLVVSHDDDDHASGLQEVLSANPRAVLVSSLQPHELVRRSVTDPPAAGYLRCEWGQSWAWDGVHFRILYPYPDRRLAERSGNDDSCVLEVTDTAGRRVILAGDLSSEAEADWWSQQAWISKQKGPLLLMAPHHGSRGSLSEDTLRVLRPDWVFSQSRYQGRFQHPHPEVVGRLEVLQIPFYRTDLQGALRMRFEGDALKVRAVADDRRFWHLPRLLRDPAAVHVPGDAADLVGSR